MDGTSFDKRRSPWPHCESDDGENANIDTRERYCPFRPCYPWDSLSSSSSAHRETVFPDLALPAFDLGFRRRTMPDAMVGRV